MKHIYIMLLCTSAIHAGCTSAQKQEIKSGARDVGHTTREVTREIGHTTRDATRETGHFFRDTAKEVFGDDDAANEKKSKSEKAE